MKGARVLFQCIFLAYVASTADSALHEYCEIPINSSDCGTGPDIVYTYLSPMGFCHPVHWKGCPTYNKFASQRLCMQHCITGLEAELGNCNVPINQDRCVKTVKEVFTFDLESKKCVKALWYGCPTENKFSDYATCAYACQDEWSNSLANIRKSDVSNVEKARDAITSLIYHLEGPEGDKSEKAKTRKYLLRKLKKINYELEKRAKEEKISHTVLMNVISNAIG